MIKLDKYLPSLFPLDAWDLSRAKLITHTYTSWLTDSTCLEASFVWISYYIFLQIFKSVASFSVWIWNWRHTGVQLPTTLGTHPGVPSLCPAEGQWWRDFLQEKTASAAVSGSRAGQTYSNQRCPDKPGGQDEWGTEDIVRCGHNTRRGGALRCRAPDLCKTASQQ